MIDHGAAYDAVAYRSWPISECHPVRMATIAGLAGVSAPDPSTASVVDLGCGDGGNLLSIAAAHPELRALGVDLSPVAIGRAEQLRVQAGLTNVSFAAVSADAAPVEAGSVDYVIVHGVLSWVEPSTRRALVQAASRMLRPGGLLLLSYNALPGGWLRAATRDLARRAARTAIERGDVAEAHWLAVERLKLAAAVTGDTSAYGRVVAAEAERLATVDPAVLFHDELAEVWTPLAVSDVSALAAEHGLVYVGEMRRTDRWEHHLPADEADHLRRVAGGGPVEQQQLFDDLEGAAFHSSLFTRPATAAGDPALPDFGDWHVTGWPGLATAAAAADDPAAAVAHALAAASERAVPLGALAGQVGQSAAEVRANVAGLDAAGLAWVTACAPAASRTPGLRPVSSPLARAQLARGDTVVTSLDHQLVEIDQPQARELMVLLDGSRDVPAVQRALTEFPSRAGADAAVGDALAGAGQLEAHLAALARAGLLVG